MKKFEADFETLKEILEHIHTSNKLDNHPWTKAHFVQDALVNQPSLLERNPGEQLLIAVADLFRQMMPGSPPKIGLRLDARWCQFGFLAAKYFSPIVFGNPVPVSFQDAWEKIDQSILLFVYGKTGSELTLKETEPYKLVGNESEVTPISTMSDWHRKGLQRLLEIIEARENHLAADSLFAQAKPNLVPVSANRKKSRKRVVWLSVGLLLLVLLAVVGAKAMRIYKTGMLVYDDVIKLQESVEFNPSLEEIEIAGPLLVTLQDDLDAFRSEVNPFLWLGPQLRWVPNYGCELASSRELLDMAGGLTDASVESYHAAQPVIQTFGSDTAERSPAAITALLYQAQPQFSSARGRLAEARTARNEIDADCLSPYVHDTLVGKVDPILGLMEDALTIAVELPRLVGSTSEGPKTYLLLVENQDELRPTGGLYHSSGHPSPARWADG